MTTEAIQKTIDAAAKARVGKIIIPRGTYLSGALFVKSNVELNIGEGVIIQAIQDNSHYPRLWTRIAGIEMKCLLSIDSGHFSFPTTGKIHNLS